MILGMWPSGSDVERSMLICQLTDLHVCAPGQLLYGTTDTNAMAARALAAATAFRPAPSAILVTGDLVEDGSEAAYANFVAMTQNHRTAPAYAIPGNHDHRDNMRRHLKDFPAMSGCGAFVQYTVDDLPVRLVMLDTVVVGAAHGLLCADRLRFLEQVLAAQPDRPTIIAMHHPPIVCGIEFMDRDNLRNSPEFQAIVARHRQVRLITGGHVHRPVTGSVAGIPTVVAPSPGQQMALSLEAGAPGASVLEPAAMMMHRWTESDGCSSHLAFVDPAPGPFLFDG